MFDLAGTVALVTGGGTGLGRACALALADAGADVIVAARRREPLDAVVAEVRARGRTGAAVTFDATDPASITALVETAATEHGGIDVFVNNAGLGGEGSFLGLSLEDWDAVMAVNLRGAFVAAQAVARRMVQQGRGGRIINMASITAARPFPKLGAYGTSKAGVIHLTKLMALELAKHEITVNALAPGWIPSEMNVGAQADPAWDRAIVEGSPMKRWGRPEEVAAACVFLAAPEAGFITGEVIRIDGGSHIA